ncbi:MAG: glycosyl transferase [Methyloceanibacter sp.]|uniref:glycosyl transferase n=1 Tax=Methyloceanibacter sp. TaxID=1965321 RepID=UPI003D6D976D
MPEAVVSWVAVVAGSAGLSAGLILLLKPLLVRYLLARPNSLSSHSTATPQGAGLAVMAALLVMCGGALLLGVAPPPPSLLPVLAGIAFLTVLGGLDDARALPVSWRFIGQTLAALLVVLTLPSGFRLIEFLPLGLERVLMVLGVVWFVNAINFLDGLDWMTVAQVVPMALGVAILQSLGVVPPSIGLLALALLGAMLGFAVFNKHPAQVFLGDAGSLPIGLCLAYLLIYVAEAHLVSGLLLALYSLADSMITLCRRMLDGEPILSGHRRHFYQRAAALGLAAPQVTARVFALGLLLMVLAIAAALAKSLAADCLLLALGAGATVFVLFNFSRGR